MTRTQLKRVTFSLFSGNVVFVFSVKHSLEKTALEFIFVQWWEKSFQTCNYLFALTNDEVICEAQNEPYNSSWNQVTIWSGCQRVQCSASEFLPYQQQLYLSPTRPAHLRGLLEFLLQVLLAVLHVVQHHLPAGEIRLRVAVGRAGEEKLPPGLRPNRLARRASQQPLWLRPKC